MDQLATPCGVVELTTLEDNLGRLARDAVDAGVAVRPHIKTHKCPSIAARQLAQGAIGVTVATLDEAAGMAAAGVEDILVYYPTVGEEATARLLALAENAQISTTVDSAAEANRLDAAARSKGTTLDVLIDVDTGLDRTGVKVGRELDELARGVERMPGLRLNGIGTHEGFAYSIREPAERAKVLDERLGEFAAAGRRLGVETVSCGSTPSLSSALQIEGMTEVRPGNYAFFDRIQVDLGVAKLGQCAFSVLSTVISVRGASRATVDAGSKALTSDRGAHGTTYLQGHGVVRDRPELSVPTLSEEHGFLRMEGKHPIAVGDRLRIIPNHSCGSVACFGSLFLVNGDEVVAEMALAGRRGDRE
jgi:D-serine deaminase-like pyridoxal phosphate-dependent protein